jgi:hypothetical protein
MMLITIHGVKLVGRAEELAAGLQPLLPHHQSFLLESTFQLPRWCNNIRLELVIYNSIYKY